MNLRRIISFHFKVKARLQHIFVLEVLLVDCIIAKKCLSKSTGTGGHIKGKLLGVFVVVFCLEEDNLDIIIQRIFFGSKQVDFL